MAEGANLEFLQIDARDGAVEEVVQSSPPDVCAMLLADKRSENTRRAYAHDVKAFFVASYGSDPTPHTVGMFLKLSTPEMVRRMLVYKSELIAAKMSEATINRRMSALVSLVAFARRIGQSTADPGDQIDSERVQPYRDTRGIDLNTARHLLARQDRSKLKGKRDYLVLLFLLENALRRAELTSIRLTDVSRDGSFVWISGKGRGTQRERITLSVSTSEAIRDYLTARESVLVAVDRERDVDQPFLISLSPAAMGRALTPDGVYKIVREAARAAGIREPLSPHRLRHTSITLALDAVGGDVRRVQRLSRHVRLETLQIYDDNRLDLQGEVTNELSVLFGGSGSKASE